MFHIVAAPCTWFPVRNTCLDKIYYAEYFNGVFDRLEKTSHINLYLPSTTMVIIL